MKARASTSALWSPAHIQPLTFSEDDQSSMMFSQENSRAAAVGRLSACSRRKFVPLLIKVFAMRDMGTTAEQQQGGAEALGELHPFKAQTAVTVQEFCHQRCTQDAGIKTWEPLSPGSADSISHSVHTTDLSDKGSRAAAPGDQPPSTSPCSHGWASDHRSQPSTGIFSRLFS